MSDFIPYKKYINSPDWAAKKERFKKSGLFRKGRCWVCTSTKIETHIHHQTYKRLGNERLNDLRILCAVCHAAIHNRMHLKSPAGKMRRKWHDHACKNNLWHFRLAAPDRYAIEVAKFFRVTDHEFVKRLKLNPLQPIKTNKQLRLEQNNVVTFGH